MPAPLDGIRVIDAASFLAAPTAASLLADMGADVIKVEAPGGDSATANQRAAGNAPAVNAGRETTNHGKRSIALDFTTAAGRDVMMRLIDTADILIHNYPVSRAQRFGLTWEAVHARNPRVVHASLSAFGGVGPDADRLGFDSTSFWARSGIQSLLGDVSAPPVESLAGLGDRVTALNLTVAVLAALRLRDMTGEGQQVEVALQQTGAWTISGLVQGALLKTPGQSRPNRLDLQNPLSITYATRDNRWLVLRMVMNLERDWPIFCEAVGKPEWVAEFPDARAVAAHANELRERVEALLLSQDLDYWRERLDPTGLIWAPIFTVEDVAADPQMRAVHAFEEVDHPTAGKVELVAAPFTIRDADIRIRRTAPEIGEHTNEVLLELGYSSQEVDALAREGVFGKVATDVAR